MAKNLPLLTDIRASYANQMLHALARGDRIAVNHRIAVFLASYFDALFAANRRLHPGEKRLLHHAAARGMQTPPAMVPMVERLITAADGQSESEVAHLVRCLSNDLTQLAANLQGAS